MFVTYRPLPDGVFINTTEICNWFSYALSTVGRDALLEMSFSSDLAPQFDIRKHLLGASIMRMVIREKLEIQPRL